MTNMPPSPKPLPSSPMPATPPPNVIAVEIRGSPRTPNGPGIGRAESATRLDEPAGPTRHDRAPHRAGLSPPVRSPRRADGSRTEHDKNCLNRLPQYHTAHRSPASRSSALPRRLDVHNARRAGAAERVLVRCGAPSAVAAAPTEAGLLAGE